MAKKRLWNDGWSFTELPVEDASYEFPVNATWQYVDIPHDWMIYKTHELYRDSIGWYKKEFCMEELSGQTLLRFDGVYMDTTVYINGTPVKEWKYGYSMFEADISDYITEGKNLVAVRVVYRYLNTRWYSGAGIFRNVYLRITNKSHIAENGVYISTSAGGELGLPVGGKATTSFTVLCSNPELAIEELKALVDEMEISVLYTKTPVEYDDGTESIEETKAARVEAPSAE